MEYWKMEQRAEENRAQIQHEFAVLRLQQDALRTSLSKQGWFARNMVTLGTWMVSIGERLRKHYKVIPAAKQTMDCNTAQ